MVDLSYYQLKVVVLGSICLFMLWFVPWLKYRKRQIAIYDPLFVQAFGYSMLYVIPAMYICFFPYLDRGYGYSQLFDNGLLLPFSLS